MQELGTLEQKEVQALTFLLMTLMKTLMEAIHRLYKDITPQQAILMLTGLGTEVAIVR